jgi:sugar/nucleoside kinase (ribokinase family)
MFDFIGLGELLVDFLPGDQPGTYIRHAGGAPANVAVSVARNGLRSGFCGKLGNDEFGHFLIKTIEGNNVTNLCSSMCDDAITTMSFVTLDEFGERHFTFARKPGADTRLEINDLPIEEIKNCRIFHTGSCSLSMGSTINATIEAIETAKLSQQAKVSFDVNYRDSIWNGSRDLAKKAVFSTINSLDFIKLSTEEADILGGKENFRDIMTRHDVSLIVLTEGKSGATAFYKDLIVQENGIETDVVDTTGAGDAFWGAFLSSILRSTDGYIKEITETEITKALKYGNISGMMAVQKKGAIDAIPGIKRIEQMFKDLFGKCETI